MASRRFDFCNECGNCDVFCPDLGGPYTLKPTFFSSLAQYREFSSYDGFYVKVDGPTHSVWGRLEGSEYRLEVDTSQTDDAADLPTGTFHVDGLSVGVSADGLSGAAAEGQQVDGTIIVWLNLLRRGVLAAGAVNYPKLMATK